MHKKTVLFLLLISALFVFNISLVDAKTTKKAEQIEEDRQACIAKDNKNGQTNHSTCNAKAKTECYARCDYWEDEAKYDEYEHANCRINCYNNEQNQSAVEVTKKKKVSNNEEWVQKCVVATSKKKNKCEKILNNASENSNQDSSNGGNSGQSSNGGTNGGSNNQHSGTPGNYQIGNTTTNEDIDSYDIDPEFNPCESKGTLSTLKLLGIVLIIAKVMVPVIIIVVGIAYMIKALIIDDHHETAKAATGIIRRIILGIVIFFIPSLLDAILQGVSNYSEISNKYSKCSSCWNYKGSECDAAIDNAKYD